MFIYVFVYRNILGTFEVYFSSSLGSPVCTGNWAIFQLLGKAVCVRLRVQLGLVSGQG